MRTPTVRIEPLFAICIAQDELVALVSAITHYRMWLARTAESAIEHQDTLLLLSGFQHRLTTGLRSSSVSS